MQFTCRCLNSEIFYHVIILIIKGLVLFSLTVVLKKKKIPQKPYYNLSHLWRCDSRYFIILLYYIYLWTITIPTDVVYHVHDRNLWFLFWWFTNVTFPILVTRGSWDAYFLGEYLKNLGDGFNCINHFNFTTKSHIPRRHHTYVYYLFLNDYMISINMCPDLPTLCLSTIPFTILHLNGLGLCETNLIIKTSFMERNQ